MLFHDIWATVRLTLFPLLIGGALIFGLMYFIFGFELFEVFDGSLRPQDATTGLILPSIVSLVILVTAICWSAVGWHRYVLLQERPGVLLPQLRGPFLAAYFWAGLKVFLVTMFGFSAVLFLGRWIGSLLGMGETAMVLVSSAVLVVATAMTFRIALIIPAAAIGKPISMTASWRSTDGYLGALVMIVIASNILGGLVNAIDGTGVAMSVLMLIVNWLNFTLSISILTTLYGYCIERRELD